MPTKEEIILERSSMILDRIETLVDLAARGLKPIIMICVQAEQDPKTADPCKVTAVSFDDLTYDEVKYILRQMADQEKIPTIENVTK